MDDESGWRTSRDIDHEVRKEMARTRRTGSYVVGYSRPPPDTRWKPGQSGNPRGRPKKVERSLSERQMVRDLIDAMEREVTITIDGKRRKVPLIKAILEQAILQAAKGKFRFAAKLFEMYENAIRVSATLNPKVSRLLEDVERHLVEVGDEALRSPEALDQINELRRKTRKF